MKYLIMCEGPNEKKIMELLLEHDQLIFQQEDLVGLSIYHARQIEKSTAVQANLRIYGGEVAVLRIGDKMSDRLKIPAEFRHQIMDVKKYCTLPELEILLIISENMFKEYDKGKSHKHPKQFAKEHIMFNKMKYNGASEFYEQYYGTDIPKLIHTIREYKHRNHSHKEDEHYLFELLKA